MREFRRYRFIVALVTIAVATLAAGCSGMRIKDGELYFDNKTSATIEDVGVARVTNHF